MKKSYILASLVLSLFANSALAEVIEITTQDEFDETIKNGKVVVKFYAPWCGACEQSEGPYNEASEKVKDVTFAKVNVETLPKLSQEYDASAIPTFVYLIDGEKINSDVGGKSTKERMIEAVNANFAQSVNSSVEAAHSEISKETTEHHVAAQAQAAAHDQAHHDEAAGILGKIKAAIMWVFTSIKNLFVGIIDTIKGFFGRK